MLKFGFLVAAIFVTCAFSQVLEVKKHPKDIVVHEVNDNDGSGKFYSLRVTLDGGQHEQFGYLEANPDPYGKPLQVIQGRFTEITPEGPKTVTYIADKTGYHPVGDHLPQQGR